MGTQRPTLREIIERIEQDIVGRILPGTPPRMALARILARGEAGLAHGLYGYMDTKEKNFLPDSGDEASVLRWATLLGITRLAPVVAVGTVQATGTNDAVIPAGRELKSSSQLTYIVDADVTIAAGVASVAITAAEAGSVGNLATGEKLTFTQPVSGVLASVTVESPGLAAGSDIETIEALRVRVLDRMKAPPRGGAESDYVAWAKEAHPEVTRAWAVGQELSDNSVTIRLVTDDAPGGLIPSGPVLAAVEAYIEARRPMTAEIYVAAPTPVELDLSIAISPNTQAVKDAITAELEDLLKREAEPEGTILISRINEAISNAAGESDHDLTVPTANVEHDTGEIAVLGEITWSAL